MAKSTGGAKATGRNSIVGLVVEESTGSMGRFAFAIFEEEAAGALGAAFLLFAHLIVRWIFWLAVDLFG